MGANLPDIETLIQAGISPSANPKNKAALAALGNKPKVSLKENLRKNYRIVDEQNAINRFKWINLVDGLDGNLLERVLYYKGAGMFFYNKTLDRYFFLPFALSGGIDIYGRYTGCKPLPFHGSTDVEDKNGKWKQFGESNIREPIWEIKADAYTEKDKEKYCVLLTDYSKQISQTVIPRYLLQDPIIDVMSNMIPYMNTALMTSTGVKGIRVNGDDEADQVKALSKQLEQAALTGDPWLAINAAVELQELTNGTTVKAEDYMLALNELDNHRLSMLGLDSGGLYNKKSTVTDGQVAMQYVSPSSIMQDGLKLRQNFCDLVNDLFGLGIWCVEDENVSGMPSIWDDRASVENDVAEESEGGSEDDTNV